jgi:hypothetical protein
VGDHLIVALKDIVTMPPDSNLIILQLMPNNSKLSSSTIKVMNTVFKTRYLPVGLIKLMVSKAFQLVGQNDMAPESTAFKDKLTEYAKSVKPRFNSQISQMQRNKGHTS